MSKYSICPLLSAASGGSNLVVNPGFESSGNWNGIASASYPGTSFYRSTWGTAGPHGGSYGYALSNQAYGYLQSDFIAVTPGAQYDLYAWVRGELDADDSAGSWIVRAYYYNSSNTALSYQDAASGAAGSLTTAWQQKGGRITAPANAAKVRIQLYSYMNSGWAAYDDVTLIPASGGSNLVVNPGFESSGNWNGIASSSFPNTSFYRGASGTASSHGGSYGYAISNHAYGYLQSDLIAVTAGAQYDLYAWVRGELDADDSNGSWIIRAYYYNSSDAALSYQDAASGAAGSLTTAWQQQGGRITAPANAAKVRIQLYSYMNSGWVAYDDISLKPVGTYNLSYDAENRLVGVSGAATATFVYDGDGKRVKSVEGGVTTVYVGNYFEWKGSTSTMVKYYYAGAQRIAMRSGSGAETVGLTFLLEDHLGSTSVSYEASTGATAHQGYMPWGSVRYGTLPTDYTYTGQKSDSYINLIWMNSRWYDPALGRWTQPDTIIPEASQGVLAWDRFAYVNNNALRYTDPTGHCLVLCTAIIGTAIGAVTGAVVYTLTNQGQSFNSGEFWTAVGAGAITGALIGSGAGILAAGATTAAAATASSLIGAGTSAAITEASYMTSNPGGFETAPFVIQTGASTVAGAITSNPGASLTAKTLANIGAAEAAYFTTGDNHSTTGAFTTAGVAALGTGYQFVFDSMAPEYLMINRSIGTNFSRMPSASGFVASQNTRTTIYGTFSGIITGLSINAGQSIAIKIDKYEEK